MKAIANNKRAFFDYFIEEKIEAGIELVGSEVKSIRKGGISINESFVQILNGEIFLKNAYIKPYEMSANFLPDSKRTRKLLVAKSEILKLEQKVKVKGFSIIPLKVYITRNLVKVEIGLAKGKKLYDKRETLKEKSVQREIDRAIVNI
ncbi:MAG: SsrA-binding protein SmpB [Clostridia bacterium]